MFEKSILNYINIDAMFGLLSCAYGQDSTNNSVWVSTNVSRDSTVDVIRSSGKSQDGLRDLCGDYLDESGDLCGDGLDELHINCDSRVDDSSVFAVFDIVGCHDELVTIPDFVSQDASCYGGGALEFDWALEFDLHGVEHGLMGMIALEFDGEPEFDLHGEGIRAGCGGRGRVRRLWRRRTSARQWDSGASDCMTGDFVAGLLMVCADLCCRFAISCCWLVLTGLCCRFADLCCWLVAGLLLLACVAGLLNFVAGLLLACFCWLVLPVC